MVRVDERPEFPGARVLRQAELVIDAGMVGFPGAKHLYGHPGRAQDRAEPLGLGSVVGVFRHVEDQERRNALVGRDVGHGGKLAVLLLGAEFDPVSGFWLRLPVRAPAGLRGGDDGWQIVGVAVDRHAPAQGGEGHPVRPQAAFVGAEQRGELGAG